MNSSVVLVTVLLFCDTIDENGNFSLLWTVTPSTTFYLYPLARIVTKLNSVLTAICSRFQSQCCQCLIFLNFCIHQVLNCAPRHSFQNRLARMHFSQSLLVGTLWSCTR